MTWTYLRLGFVGLGVVTPYARLPNDPGCGPPKPYPPPSVPPIDSQIWLTYPSKKLLKLAWLDGNFPFCMAVSAISDLMEDPALVMYRPMLSLLSTVEFEPSNHHAPLEGSL